MKDKQLYEDSIKNDWEIQFSHTIEDKIGGQLKSKLPITCKRK